MKTIYAVLNDKLYPVDVAELLLTEGAGSDFTSVDITLNPDQDPDFNHLEDLFIKAAKAGINHSFTYSFIYEMLLKLLSNNKHKPKKIMVRIVQEEKTFLHIYFLE